MQRSFYIFSFLIFLYSCSPRTHQARFVLLPDTQYYAEKYPDVLDSQVSWVMRNAASINLVLQQGDLTQNNNDREWTVVQQSFSKLDHSVPYILCVGNHDMGSTPGKFADTRNTSLFNRYFPPAHMARLPGFGGVFEEGKTDNAYYFTETGKVRWMILTLEFGPRNSVLEWANRIVEANRDRLVIVNTHSYMYSDSTRQGPGDSWRPQSYGIGKDSSETVNDGEQIWNKLVRLHPNIRFVFSGHVLNSGVGTLVSVNDHGYHVYQMLANFQSEVKGSVRGGNGYLRILDLDFKKKTVKVTTWSPYVNEEKKEKAHRFILRDVRFNPGEVHATGQ